MTGWYRARWKTPKVFPGFSGSEKKSLGPSLTPRYGVSRGDAIRPRRCRRRTARSHRRNVPPEGRRDYGRHAAPFTIKVGHIAQYNTRHANGTHVRHRSDGERLFRRKAASVMADVVVCLSCGQTNGSSLLLGSSRVPLNLSVRRQKRKGHQTSSSPV